MEAEVVGRESELAAIQAFLGEGGSGARALLIAGEAGIGKTTVFRTAVARAESDGRRVLLARPAEGELELPHAALADLLETVSGETLAALAAPQRAAVETALGRTASARSVDRHALWRGVLELLRVECAGGDVLIAVDDVQWLDRATAAALTFAFRRLRSDPVRLLVAARVQPDAPSQLPLGLDEWSSPRHVAVGPLPATELGMMLAQQLGVRHARPRLERLARVSGGNPLFAMELARREGGTGRALSLASTLSRTLTARLRELDSPTQSVLGLVSAALQPTVDLMLRAGVDRVALRSVFGTGIVELDGERLSFAHPLLGSAAYEILLPDERRRIHERLASASTNPVERGHHVSRSATGPDEAAAQCLVEAGDAAGDLGDHAGAAAFLIRAAELSPDPAGEAAQSSQLRAATELELAGDVEAAATLARTLVGTLPQGIARAQARRTLVSCLVGAGVSYEEGLSELALALDDAAADDATSAQLHVVMADFTSGMCRLEESVAHLKTAIELAERAGATPTAVTALADLGFVECMLGRGVTEASRRAFALWDGTVLSASGYSPRMSLGCVCIHATEFARAEALFQEEIAMAEDRGLEAVEAAARVHLAEAQLRAGGWSAALSNARAAVEHARQAANAQTATGASYSLAMIEALLGQHEVAREIASEALAMAEVTKDFWFRVSHRAVLGLVALAEDDPQTAVEVLAPAWTLMLEQGLGDLSIFPVAQVLGEALVSTGRLREATEVAEALRNSPTGRRPWCRAMANRCAALVASAGRATLPPASRSTQPWKRMPTFLSRSSSRARCRSKDDSNAEDATGARHGRRFARHSTNSTRSEPRAGQRRPRPTSRGCPVDDPVTRTS